MGSNAAIKMFFPPEGRACGCQQLQQSVVIGLYLIFEVAFGTCSHKRNPAMAGLR
jgi:hypothetical protein